MEAWTNNNERSFDKYFWIILFDKSWVNVFKKNQILKNKSKASAKKELNKAVIISESTKYTKIITNNNNNKTNNNAKSVSKGEVIMKRIITKIFNIMLKKRQ